MPSNVIQFTVKGSGGENAGSTFGKVAKGIGLVAAAIGGLAAIKSIGSSVVEFEKLRLSINTVSKSAKDASANMDLIESFAAKTPFDLNQVTEGFIKLKALGLDPSEEAMTSYGNTASAMGKSLNQMVEAIADAATGEFERLKEFGIKAKNEGEVVKFTFQGVTTQIANNAEDIEGYLRDIGQTEFAGAMATQANSVVGAVSNMKDNFNRLAVAIGDAGVRPLIKAAALAISRLVEVMIQSKDKISAFIQKIVFAVLVIKQVFVNVVTAIKGLMEQDLKSALTSIWDTLKRVGEIILQWAGAIVPAIGKLFLTGFPIILKGVASIFKTVFTDIGILMIDIIALAYTSFIKAFAAFGEAINDEINEAFFGGNSATFGENLRNRFREHFEGAMAEASIVLQDAGNLGEKVVDDVVATVGELSTKLGPVIGDSIDTIVAASTEAGTALADVYGLNMELIMEQAEQMTEGMSAFQDKAAELQEESIETHESMMELFRASWETFVNDQGAFVQEFAKTMIATAKTVSKSIGKAFADTIVDGKNLMKALQDVIKSVIKTLISSLIELGVQRLITAAIGKTAAATEASSANSANLGRVASGQMASMSEAPFPVNLTAPAVSAAMVGIATGMTAGAMATGAGMVPAAHGGLTNVPSESTYLLDKGERVLSPNQNKDFTDFLGEDQGGGQSIIIETLELSILENVTDIDSFLNMTVEEVKEIVAERIIPAFDTLDSEGVRPAFADRELNT